MAPDVLISYSSKDKLSADAICARLEEKIQLLVNGGVERSTGQTLVNVRW